jgi:hypothetical protein
LVVSPGEKERERGGYVGRRSNPRRRCGNSSKWWSVPPSLAPLHRRTAGWPAKPSSAPSLLLYVLAIQGAHPSLPVDLPPAFSLAVPIVSNICLCGCFCIYADKVFDENQTKLQVEVNSFLCYGVYSIVHFF